MSAHVVGASTGGFIAQQLAMPVLVIHGEMGHELPRPLWPEMVRAISENANRRMPAPTT